jgi:hypothetical protein
MSKTFPKAVHIHSQQRSGRGRILALNESRSDWDVSVQCPPDLIFCKDMKSGQKTSLSKFLSRQNAHCLDQDEDDITIDSVLLLSPEEIRKIAMAVIAFTERFATDHAVKTEVLELRFWFIKAVILAKSFVGHK